MKKPNIVQLNNQYITDENLKKRYREEENLKKNRFMGTVLVFVMLLFILPAYNLVSSYRNLQERKDEVVKLTKEYQSLTKETQQEKLLVEQLKNEDYVEKYARAKYYLARQGETIYPVPSLLPK
ncbi:FtsB family cell division protein [Streptococcus orisratti]|uniref:FtsB family cell division protein n=1 Tax=Streptococcus orisratti TaxID=114652 RepID=UPI0023F926A6|nr:septum formation initiator family protein [Streptococcus orisratti]